MTAKEYLMQIRDTSKNILFLNEELKMLNTQKDNLKSVEISEKVQSSMIYGNYLDELLDREKQIIAEERKIHNEWWHCRQMIKQIIDKDQSDALRYYYLLNYKTWDIVADKIHVSQRKIYFVHGTALQNFRKISGFE